MNSTLIVLCSRVFRVFIQTNNNTIIILPYQDTVVQKKSNDSSFKIKTVMTSFCRSGGAAADTIYPVMLTYFGFAYISFLFLFLYVS